MGTEGGTAVYPFSGGGVVCTVCVCVTQGILCNVIYKTCVNVNFAHLCLVHCIYLGEEVEAAQAADDAVDLREPSAFAAGLRTASKKKTGSKHWRVTRLLIQEQPQDWTSGAEQSFCYAETLTAHLG